MTLALALKRQLDNFDLHVEHTIQSGKITGIFGASGAGKSTLLKAIAGLDTDTQGMISFEKTMWLDSNKAACLSAEDRPLSLVFQDARLFPHLSVYDNVNFAYKRRKTQLVLSLDELLAGVDMSNKKHAKVASLSGGEQQRIALVRALALMPKVLLLDEPFNALDKASKAQVFKLLKHYQARFDTTILFVSHQLDDIYQLADQLLVMEQGKVIDSGDTKAVTLRLNTTNLIEPHTHIKLQVSNANNGHGLAELSLNTDNNSAYSFFINSEKLNSSATYVEANLYAKDVSISLSDTIATSMVNNLPAVITTADHQSTTVLLTLTLGEEKVFSKITSYSFEKMNLTIGQQVFVQFKASALDVIEQQEQLC